VDLGQPYIFGGGWIVTCDSRYQYRYDIEDHGGKWTVEAEAR
jgi:hypothetical protein